MRPFRFSKTFKKKYIRLKIVSGSSVCVILTLGKSKLLTRFLTFQISKNVLEYRNYSTLAFGHIRPFFIINWKLNSFSGFYRLVSNKPFDAKIISENGRHCATLWDSLKSQRNSSGKSYRGGFSSILYRACYSEFA